MPVHKVWTQESGVTSFNSALCSRTGLSGFEALLRFRTAEKVPGCALSFLVSFYRFYRSVWDGL